jgi:hypothetical protein
LKKQGEVWTAEYRSVEAAHTGTARWTEEYNRDRPHRVPGSHTLREVFSSCAALLRNEAVAV